MIHRSLFQYQRTNIRNPFGNLVDSDVGVLLNKSNPVKASGSNHK